MCIRDSTTIAETSSICYLLFRHLFLAVFTNLQAASSGRFLQKYGIERSIISLLDKNSNNPSDPNTIIASALYISILITLGIEIIPMLAAFLSPKHLDIANPGPSPD
eukprot:TRINITY_DN19649_c0_g1_i1.p4 TRINITY_DN19649_c0_g1~~TRINITY_DN19649_c0_g1_i1.p4  ORF type:complete len:107 (+),score=3.55 TRINITY_DN19649_c0_g1_i1:162-482(+)